MDLELRHLRSFVAVAEELNFTRAAQRLHLAQPALSTQIRQLEDRVGAKLLDRTTRRVALTPAGEALLDHARSLLAGAQGALDAVQAVTAGTTGRLTVGLHATAALAFTPRVLRAFQAAHPAVTVSVRNFGFDDPSGGVRSGGADIALVWLPFREDDLEVEPLFDDPRVIAMAADHPLASRERLVVADLLDEPMVRVDGVDPIADAYWGLHAERGGPRPGSTTVTGMEDLLTAVRAGLAIETIPSSIAETLTGSDLAIREVEGLSPSTVALCRPAGARDPLLEAFAAAARAVAAMPDPSP